ncbi:bifunctional [glutamate--ammonia ligase]-adenylyl-L-tyrosine phosphorylase/[glutamate--ammonia-ligase] adenylyltransferase [Hydromonas duriensis]|uniref:Bifunctional glutamine synthetase adenylyltransferase/adenylyl-removing enzyme n=1 Tax=Hydromonas duriensis TaxID=1527608 RepID=A0A4R6YB11_9BURK|nr:bifunctional [glutamate--ammonia ligase]-adenylyl-L-tyrosine phosphorylase/[glutamate--ammonia-ligase] adenylyltransferase [Hydromonas duriensis]TDR32782.1 glutamate-ammonia-ligase adenylyltransferase [Hydromonas duriensis]
MNPLLAENYSNYARTQLANGRLSAEHVMALLPELPLSIDDIARLIQTNTPAHHDPEVAAGIALRRTRTLIMVTLMEYNLTHPLDEKHLNVVTQTISALADASTLHALNISRAALREIHGEPLRKDGSPMPLWVMGMGKLAGHELNVSSDMDLIFIFEHEGDTVDTCNNPRIRMLSHGEFFERLGKRIIKLLDDVSEYGFVFRVDMRLRPNGASGALCVSLASLEKYLISNARTWERFAWLKSRLLNPDEHSQQLQNLITPFVFRRYLDYDAIDALRDVHRKIRTQANAKTAAKNNAIDIKLGEGGIREIEFIVQLFQIIKGARNPVLQQRNTLTILPHLHEQGLLSTEKTAQLTEYYVFLRHLEHHIQYIDDAQTQLLPSQIEVQNKLAHAMRFADFNALKTYLTQGQGIVSSHFNALFDSGKNDSQDSHLPQNDDYAALIAPFQEPNALQEQLARLDTDARIIQLPERSQMRYKQLILRTLAILDTQNTSPIPNEYAMRVFNFLDAIAKRSSYLALLTEYPKALAHLIKLCTRSRWAADYLTAHPILLDEMLTPALHTPPDWSQVNNQLYEDLTRANINDNPNQPDVERQMDILRETHHAQVFRLLAQELDGLWSVEELADHLSELTDIILRQALYFCWRAFPKRHQDEPKFAIIAYGKLGGKEMGYASDLDLVFLYDDTHMDASEIYSRFAQRLNNWLITPTGAGNLFETDYRLRPNGASGLLVSSIQMFKQYQAESAWFWEHQAITRARFCAGDEMIGQWFENERRAILQQPRHRDKVIHDILEMKQKIQDGHPNPTELFDVKYDVGGMVDIEFCVQALVLLHSQNHPELLDNKGNIGLLHRAGKAGLIKSETAQQAADAYRNYRAIQHAARLQNSSDTRVLHDTVQHESDAVKQLLKEVCGELP